MLYSIVAHPHILNTRRISTAIKSRLEAVFQEIPSCAVVVSKRVLRGALQQRSRAYRPMRADKSFLTSSGQPFGGKYILGTYSDKIRYIT